MRRRHRCAAVARVSSLRELCHALIFCRGAEDFVFKTFWENLKMRAAHLAFTVILLTGIAGGLAACGKGPQGDAGPAGTAGPQGPAGPPSPSVRVVKSDCTSGCTVQCQENEILVTAYCGPTRNAAQMLGERGASCGPVASPANAPLVAVCVAAPQ